MLINVERSPGAFTKVNLSPAYLSLISTHVGFKTAITDALRLESRVPDVWRYTVHVEGGVVTLLSQVDNPTVPSKYPDWPATDAAGTRVILLILESPHRYEYVRDKNGKLLARAPAQNRSLFGAGRGIEFYGHLVLNRIGLADGEYFLVIANPVPYQCSLSSVMPGKPIPLHADVRDHVWRQLFKLDCVWQNFLDRLDVYRPEIFVNCCTGELWDELTTFLCNRYLAKDSHDCVDLFQTVHSSVNWCAQSKKGVKHNCVGRLGG